jgi:PAS domain S-box-containing protein
LLEGEYAIVLVVLSVAIAMLASFMGFQVASLSTTTKNPFRKHFSLLSGSVALGGGVWSMHFIGMLAFELCTEVTYGWQLTSVSLAPAIAASWTALHYLSKKQISHKELLVGAILMGSGIGAMHYIGMAGMEMATLLRYDLGIFVLSICVAVALSYLSLWAKFKLNDLFIHSRSDTKPNLIAGVIMGLGISGMHYTGMSAARFVMPPGFEQSSQTGDISTYLALAITMIALSIIGIVLATTLIFKYKDITVLARHNENRLKATIDTSSDGIFTIDSNGSVISTNASVTKMLGWTEKELIGKSVNVVLPNTYGSANVSFISDFIESSDLSQIKADRELEAKTKSGELIPVRVGLGHAKLGKEHIYIGFISDLRQRIKMEKALRENEEKFRSLISNIPGIAYRCDNTPDWPMVFISEAVEKVTGYPASDFLMPNPKRSFADLIYPEDLQKLSMDQENADGNYVIEYRIKSKNQEMKWMLEYGRKVYSDDGETCYLDGLIMDITNRKLMEQALVIEKNNAQAAAETRAAFMANMSHEIRTPMNAIIGFSDLLLEEHLSKEQTSFITTIHQSAQSLLYIINDVLDSAKLEKGELGLEYRNFALLDVIDSVISTFGLQAQKKGVELVLDYQSSLPNFVHGVPERLRQVLINIIGNAVKFTDKGKVTIEVESSGFNKVQFSVRDEGIGMTQDQLEKVFDPFTQADASMSRKYGGTGLGTTISKQLVELMKGTISASSQKGMGSCFSFTLPLTEAESETFAEQQETVRQSLPPLRILIADDVQQNLDLLSIVLTRDEHKVVAVTDGKQAIDMLRLQEFDLAILDVQMPILDGLSAASLRREYELENELGHLPIIALTASVLEDDRLAAKRAGMDGFANKPINQDALFSEIARVLEICTDNDIGVKESSLQFLNKSYALSLWGDLKTLDNELYKLKLMLPEINKLNIDISEKVDVQSLKADLHRYKGIVGNLGLEQIFSVFQHIEQALERNDAQEYLSETNKVLKLLSAIPTSLNSRDAVRVSNHEVNEESLSLSVMIEELMRLVDMLKHSKIDDKFVEALLKGCPHRYLHLMDDIQTSIDDFEFETAALLAQDLVNQIKSEHHG